MKTKTIIILLLTFYSVTISAQSSNRITEAVPSMTVMDIDDFLAPTNGLQRTASPSTANSLNVQNVKSLIYNTQPSIYYFSGVEKVYGEKPKNLFTDLNSLSNLNNAISLKNNIEIITIKLENANQLNSSINLELFSSFKNLKYIYIVSSFDTNAQAIANMIVGINEQYSVFYNVEKGDTN
ncbi:hypothetical protein ACSVH2_07695 [Flavobacterium sp. RSB2_4_14]|uniref:hypothetical protein n=1 Tax=Flavobacterium sp. RSB2_4_14 TaxID=3447665 RepID=UPI003F40BD57